MPRLIVGVDAGGTKTAAALRADGGEPHVIYGEGASATALGAGPAANVISNLIEAALDGAMPHAIAVGLAGAGRPEVERAVRASIERRFPAARVQVRDDAVIALRAAIPQDDGVVLVAGTGSIAYAERGGAGFRCGGYGYLIGDEGSGFAIGAAGIKHALRCLDGRAPKDALAARLEEFLGGCDAAAVLAGIYGSPRPVREVARAAVIVLDAAGAGERSAVKIVQAAALDLAALAGSVITKARLEHSHAPIAFAGGLLTRNTMLTYLLETRLLNEHPAMPLRKDPVAPYLGALALAENLLA